MYDASVTTQGRVASAPASAAAPQQAVEVVADGRDAGPAQEGAAEAARRTLVTSSCPLLVSRVTCYFPWTMEPPGPQQSPHALHFSNAALVAFIHYLDRHFGAEATQELLLRLGVTREWAENQHLWHSAGFQERLFGEIKRLVPGREDVIYEVARSGYAEGRIGIFWSFLGLVRTPDLLFSKLATAASRMNAYNTYEYARLRQTVAITTGRLTQKYLMPENGPFNRDLCDAMRGSTEGCFAALGYQLLDIGHTRCVKRGDPFCEIECTSTNRPILKQVLAWAAATTISAFLAHEIGGWPLAPCAALTGLVSGLLFLLILRHTEHRSRLEILEFQKRTLSELRGALEQNQDLNQSLLEFQKKTSEIMAFVNIFDMSYGAIHDMSSPITLLMLSAGELNRQIQRNFSQDPHLLKHSGTIDRATQQLTTLLKLFRTTVNGYASEEIIDVDLHRVLADCVGLHEPLFEKHGIRCRVAAGEGGLNVRAPVGTVESICLNLIHNATKALRRSDVKALDIEARRDGDRAVLVIQDSGPGLPAARLKEVWSRFGRAGATRAPGEKIEGTGFGLYHVHKLVARAAGTIDYHSSPAGTRFTITLPIGHDQNGERAQAG